MTKRLNHTIEVLDFAKDLLWYADIKQISFFYYEENTIPYISAESITEDDYHLIESIVTAAGFNLIPLAEETENLVDGDLINDQIVIGFTVTKGD